MKYMGSKRELLDHIEQLIIKNNKTNSAVLDLFSGTCSVGMCMRDKFPIYSNDVQYYSQVISEGIISSDYHEDLSKNEIWDLVETSYQKNYNAVSKHIGTLLEASKSFSTKKLDTWNDSLLSKYKLFIKKLPSPDGSHKTSDKESKWLLSEYTKRNKNPSLFPFIQTTFLFGEMYFSLEQALQIDSIKYAIELLPKKYEALKKILRASLLHAHSYSSAGTGHFAQFRDLSSIESVKDVFIYRKKSVKEYFLNKALEIISTLGINKFPKESKSFSLDYIDILKNEKIMKKVGIIYADPPYGFVHYSRFYHATENISRYDYPLVKHKGRYRTNRHQSPFCIKSKVPEAFGDLFRIARVYNIPVLLSYSNTGMIDFEEIIKIAKKEGFKTKLDEIAHKHSTLGRQKDKDRDVSEKLLLCY